MSSHNGISMASSRQFDSKHIQNRVTINRTAPKQELADLNSAQAQKIAEQIDKVTLTLSPKQTVQINLLSRLVGKKIVLPSLEITADPNKVKTESIKEQPETAPLENTFILSQDYYFEAEQTTFSASGNVTLSNGEQTEFNFSMAYSREYESYSERVMSLEELQDPLIINFSDQPMSLSSETMEFDLNMDGEVDNIATLSEGAAFIALDKNNNGIIDDGSELFGAQTGDGFAELAQYDDNQDGYINNKDQIFSQLLVWQPGVGSGISKLSDSSVDTLVLQTVNTEFTFKDENNNTLGQMRKSSVYANNDGSVGSLHQVDLKI